MIFKRKASKLTPQARVVKLHAELTVLTRLGKWDSEREIRKRFHCEFGEDESTLESVARTMSIPVDGLRALVDGVFAGLDFAPYGKLPFESNDFIFGLAMIKQLMEKEGSSTNASPAL